MQREKKVYELEAFQRTSSAFNHSISANRRFKSPVFLACKVAGVLIVQPAYSVTSAFQSSLKLTRYIQND